MRCMKAFNELDKILYQDQDACAYEEVAAAYSDIYERFDDSDISALQDAWRHRPTEWLTNFVGSLSEMPRPLDPDFTLRAFWPVAWDMIYSDSENSISAGFQLLRATSGGCERRGRNYYFMLNIRFDDKHLYDIAGIWKSRYSLRDTIKQICIEAGRAGDMRRSLGLKKWSNAQNQHPIHNEAE